MATLFIETKDKPNDTLLISGRHLITAKYRELGGGGRVLDIMTSEGKITLTIDGTLNPNQVDNILATVSQVMNQKPSARTMYSIKCSHIE